MMSEFQKGRRVDRYLATEIQRRVKTHGEGSNLHDDQKQWIGEKWEEF